MNTLERKLKELAKPLHAVNLRLSTNDTYSSWQNQNVSERKLTLKDHEHPILLDTRPYLKRHYTLGVPLSLQEALAQAKRAFGATTLQTAQFTEHLTRSWQYLHGQEQDQLLTELLENYSAHKLTAAAASQTLANAQELPDKQRKQVLDRFYEAIAETATRTAFEVDDAIHTPHLLDSNAKNRYEAVNKLLTPAIARLQD